MICLDFRSALKSLLCPLALSSLLLVPSAHAQKPNIISWGENTSSWQTALGVTQMRVSCGSLTPSACEPYLENFAAEQSSTGYYYVSMLVTPSTNATYAEDFSKLSLTYKHMLEIDFDDFISQLENQQIAGNLSNPDSFVNSVITATHYYNPNLAFGATIYEDSLTHTMLTTTLTASTRARIQYVHFFVHYRENVSKLNTYLAQVRSYFPNAKIIAGNYPYDRIDYLWCTQGDPNRTPCTAAQEQSSHQSLMQAELNLYKSGSIVGVESYFGYFGNPGDWSGWTAPTACTTRSYTTCIANTNTLQSITKSTIQSGASSSSSSGSGSSGSSDSGGTITYNPSTLNMGSESVGDVSGRQTVKITNTGSSSVTFTGLSQLGSNPADFAISNNCPSTLAAGSVCDLFVQFQPHGTGTRGTVFIFKYTSGQSSISILGTGE